MTASNWLIFILIIQIIHFLSTWKMYQAAGKKSWEALIPIYNAIILMKIIQRPTWWTLLLFIPIINLMMFPVIWVETLKTFGKKSTTDTVLGLISFGFYIAYVNYTQKLVYNSNRNLNPENKTSETVSSLLFAIIVATLVHTYFVQPYTIPTSSLEKSLLIGDFLFVSKVNYGARVPTTSVALPMVHDTIPTTKNKSYLNYPQIPYFRLPALTKIQRNDIVVFNWPADTVKYFHDTETIGLRKPIDKKSNYVKRCLGVPGDSLSIKDGIVYINNTILQLPERAKPQYSYIVTTNGGNFDSDLLFDKLDITDAIQEVAKNVYYFSALTSSAAERLKKEPNVKSIERYIETKPSFDVFPQTGKWNVDNYGPIYIPQKGKTIDLNLHTLPLYKMIITEYEKNNLTINGSEIFINGQVAKNYTFKQNYYWMMGDNRHNSEDSRYWGFVPENHIVGTPVFIWMSWNSHGKGLNKVRWERLFTTVNGEGQPQSYFKIFLILLAIYFIGEYFWKKRKAKN